MKSTNVFLLAIFVLILVTVSQSTAAAPVANFKGTPVQGTSPLTVMFRDTSTGSPIGWAWYFGDETYDDVWTQVTSSAEWSARHSHCSVVMPDGSIVMMGGYGAGDKNDVWRSTDKGATWTQMTPSAGWDPREKFSCVAMPDGSIVLMGGLYSTNTIILKNDVWRSTDNGASWKQMTANPGWSARYAHSSVAMQDGSIILMGGYDGNDKNDVWRSTDNGASWTQISSTASWSPRRYFSSVAMPDGSIVLMGGGNYVLPYYLNDTWRSTDNGDTWIQVNASSGWTSRRYHSSVVTPDGSIVLMGGGNNELGIKMNDVWRSTDKGATWTQTIASSAWSPRAFPNGVSMPDGSIILIGGDDGISSATYKNDVWRLMTAGSTAQKPSHIYTKPGIYNVASQVFNGGGYNSIQKLGYITVRGPVITTGSLEVKSLPSNAKIYIDGIDTGQFTGWTFNDMKPGDYDVFVVLEGYATSATQKVTVVSEKTVTLNFRLKRIR